MRSTTMRSMTILAMGALLALAPIPAAPLGAQVDPTTGDDTARELEAPRWRITPYLWIPEIEGSSTADEDEAEGSVSFFDVLEAFGFCSVDAEPDPWGFRGDLMFLFLDGEWDTPPDTGFELDIVIVELAATRRILTLAESDPWRPEVDLTAGVRFYDADVELDFVGFGTDGEQQWLEPIVGARARWELGRSWALGLAGDIGGFDIDDTSSWQAVASVEWRPSRRFSMSLAHRILDIDASFGSRDRFALDLQLAGPMLAFNFWF